MKKFSKLVFLLVALVAIVTAFTVVALATEEPALSPVIKYQPDYDSATVGTQYEANAGGFGWFGVQTAEGSTDHYLAHLDCAVDGGSNNSYMSGTYSYGTVVQATPISDYPYAVFEADIMKPGANYSEFTFSTYIKNSGGGIKPTSGGPSKDAIHACLPTESYEWAKATVIFKYHSETVEGVLTGYLSYYIYINGQEAYKYEKATSFVYDSEGLYSECSESQLYLTDFRLNASTASETGNITAFDNVKMTVYPKTYTLDSIVAETYNDDYIFPYGKTVALVNEKGYDDIDAAIAATAEGGTLSLRSDIEGYLIINKAIKVDTNKYDSNGVATGEYYQVNLGSTEGYATTENAGVYTFALADQKVTVKWDAPCGEANCTCVGNHQFAKESIVALGEVPEYLFDTPDTEVNGLVTHLLGWSYENNGTVDTLTEITEANVVSGILNLYPVYEQTQYDFSLLIGETLTYHTADQYSAIFATAMANENSVVTLLRDTEVFDCITFTSGTVTTLDLRGNTLTRVNLSGNKYKYNASTSTYDADGTLAVANTNAFHTKAGNVNFTITSSGNAKGNFVTYAVVGDIYYDENGVFEKYSATTVNCSRFLNIYNNTYYTITLNNINIYASIVLDASGGSNKGFVFTMTGCNYYKTSGSDKSGGYTFYFESNDTFTANITDSLFYYPSDITSGNNVFMRMYGKAGKHKVTIDNCDILGLKAHTLFNFYSSDLSTWYLTEESKVTVKNSRLYNAAGNTTYTVYLDNDTLTTITDNMTAVDGHIAVSSSQTLPYSVPNSTIVTIDADGQPVLSTDIKNINVTFTKEIKLYTEVYTTVTWLDENGTLIKESEELKNSTLTAPERKIPVGDQYRAFTNPDWLDENDAIASLTIGDLDSYTFKLSTELPENPQYVASITDVRFNMIYYGHFAYNLYVPVVDGVTVNKVCGYAPHIKLIDGVEYYTASGGWPTPNTAINNMTMKVEFTVDGVNYTASYSVSAMLYAELLLSDPATVEVEKTAVLALIAYVEEAYKVKAENNTLDETTQAKFDNFFTTYNEGQRPAYLTTYDENELHTVDATFATYVDSLGFALHSNNRMTILVTLSKESVDAGYTLKLTAPSNFAGSVKDDEAGTVTYYTNNDKFRTTIMSSKYTLVVYDAEGKELASTNYSLATYCNSVECDLADALYTFGKALIAASEYLETL